MIFEIKITKNKGTIFIIKYWYRNEKKFLKTYEAIKSKRELREDVFNIIENFGFDKPEIKKYKAEVNWLIKFIKLS